MIDLIFLETHDITMMHWIASTILSIGLAVGLTLYHNNRENKLKKRNEEFFVMQITDNLEKMAQYFLDVERETTQDEEYATSNEHLMSALKSYYTRHEQEMKDILYQTKLYIPFWTNLPTHDKQTITDILDLFSWLLYDYYQPALPELLCENTVLNSRDVLFTKKDSIMNNTNQILSKHSV